MAMANDAKQTAASRAKGTKKGVEKYLPDPSARDKQGNLVKPAKSCASHARKQDPEQLFADANHRAVRQFNFRDFPSGMPDRPSDYLYFVNTYKYFLDQLLVEFS